MALTAFVFRDATSTFNGEKPRADEPKAIAGADDVALAIRREGLSIVRHTLPLSAISIIIGSVSGQIKLYDTTVG